MTTLTPESSLERPDRAEKPVSPLRRFSADFVSSKLATLGLVIFTVIALLAVTAPPITPQDPYDLRQLDIMDSRLPPGGESMSTGMVFYLGSDDQGRDLLSGIIFGLRISLMVGGMSTVVALAFGAVIGLIAAYYGGRVDTFIMRVVDIQLSFPAILTALVLLAVLGQGVDKVIIALIAAQWAYYARTIRGSALVERNREYIEAAKCLALSPLRIVLRHLLPNCMPPLIVVGTVQVAHAIALEATLSFLGLGLPVTEPSLGLLIANGYEYLLSGKYWISVFPGVALLITIVSINLMGDQLRDILNPRLQK